MNKYRFRTSLGYVEVEFDLAEVKPRDFPGRDENGADTTITTDCLQEFKLGKGKELIQEMYDGWMYQISRASDGSLWADIDLSDGYYGSPEYLLEEM